MVKFVLHVKEDRDDLLARQGCSELLATMQRRAGAKLHIARQVLRRAGAKLHIASTAMIAYTSVTILCRILHEPEAAFHALVAFL